MNSKIKNKLSQSIRKTESKDTSTIQEPSTSEGTNSSQETTAKGICYENLMTLQKIHAILLNCKNLSEMQKSEFAESERYFMKLHLKKLLKKLEPP